MFKKSFSLLILICCLAFFVQAQNNKQRFAMLGNYKLENGQVIKNCRIGYRTFGKPNSDSSNTVLVCTWFTGRSEGSASVFLSKEGFIDTSRFYVVIPDALGNGISSSPSNYLAKDKIAFPDFTMADVVQTQHRLLSQLHIKHLYAAIGISMGGMQVFQWLVSYPDFITKAISINGTPRQSAYDKLLWNTELSALYATKNCKSCPAKALQTVAMIHELHLYTPAYRAEKTLPNQYDSFMKEIQFSKNASPLDWVAQLKAMIGHDVIRNQTWAELRSKIKAKVLVAVATQDLMVNPIASAEFAKQLNCQLLELKENCGHQSSVLCSKEYLRKEIREFLMK